MLEEKNVDVEDVEVNMGDYADDLVQVKFVVCLAGCGFACDGIEMCDANDDDALLGCWW